MATDVLTSEPFEGFPWDEIRSVLRDLNLKPDCISLLAKDPADGEDLTIGIPAHKSAFVRGIYCWVGMECTGIRGRVFERVSPVTWESLPFSVRDFYVRASHACGEAGLNGRFAENTAYAGCAAAGEDAENAEYAEEGERAVAKSARARARALNRARASGEWPSLPLDWPRDRSPWAGGP